MARIRTIKPQFFLNDDLARLPFDARLLFIGLWTIADRAGRLEDRPMRIKALLFPYDSVDVDSGLSSLALNKFIDRYESRGVRLISIPSWSRHQLVSRDEPPSEFEGPNGEVDALGRAPNDTMRLRIYERDHYTCAYCGRQMQMEARARCVDHVIPLCRGGSHQERNLVTSCKKCNARKSALTPEEAGLPWPGGLGHSVNGVSIEPSRGNDKDRDRDRDAGVDGDEGRDTPVVALSRATVLERFEQFWAEYPRKVGRGACLAIWERLKPSDETTAQMIAAVNEQAKSSQWRKQGGQFIPHPRTWLNQGRWQDTPDHQRGDTGLQGLEEAIRG